MFSINVQAETYKDLKIKVLELAKELGEEIIVTQTAFDLVGATKTTTELELEREAKELEYKKQQAIHEAKALEQRKIEEEMKAFATSNPHTNIRESAPTPAPELTPSIHTTLGTIMMDSRGIVWDERIHSANKATNEDGTWRRRRGVESATVAQLERKADAAPVLTVVAPPPAPVPLVAPAPVAPLVTSPAAVLPPPMPTPTVPNGHTLETFRANLIQIMAKLINDKKINQEYIKQLNEYFEVREIYEIFGDESKVSELFENFAAAGFVQKVG